MRNALPFKRLNYFSSHLSTCRNICFGGSRCYSFSSRKDFYSILAVPRDATQRQIKSAYYSLSKKYHPDVAGAGGAEKFAELNEAYECLRDPDRRRAYDIGAVGGNARYPGDGSHPFGRQYQQQQQWTWTYQYPNAKNNPFQNRTFSRQEYQRIWEEFERLRTERERYDSSIHQKREKIWEDYMRQRAGRWKEFHDKYPNGAPGSFRWQWSSSSKTDMQKASDLFKKLLMFYFVTFFFISIVRVLLTERLPQQQQVKPSVSPPMQVLENEKEWIEKMMKESPASASSAQKITDVSSSFAVPQSLEYMAQPPPPPTTRKFENDETSGFSSYASSTSVPQQRSF